MGMIRLSTIVMFFVVFISGCTSVNKSHTNSPIEVNVSSEMTADLDVDISKKLEGIASGTYIFGFIKIGGDSTYVDGYGGFGPVGTVKSAAAYNAISKSSGDVLVSPQYIVDTKSYLLIKYINVKVSGYEGTVKAVRNKKTSGFIMRPATSL